MKTVQGLRTILIWNLKLRTYRYRCKIDGSGSVGLAYKQIHHPSWHEYISWGVYLVGLDHVDKGQGVHASQPGVDTTVQHDLLLLQEYMKNLNKTILKYFKNEKILFCST